MTRYELFQKARLILGVTRFELASLLGVQKNVPSQAEAGLRYPPEPVLERLLELVIATGKPEGAELAEKFRSQRVNPPRTERHQWANSMKGKKPT